MPKSVKNDFLCQSVDHVSYGIARDTFNLSVHTAKQLAKQEVRKSLSFLMDAFA
jgi:hypothetical protein